MIPRLTWSLAVAALSTLPATAQVVEADAGWSVQVTPYVWGSGVSGDVTPFAGGPTLEFDNSLSDVLEDLDGAFFLSGFALRDRFVFLGDISYSSSSREGLVPPGIPVEGSLRQRSATLAAGYRVQSDSAGTLDLLAGLRIWDIDVAAAAPALGAGARRGANFTDPILAARANIALNDRLSALAYVDVGGFGIGSDATAQVVATLNYAVSDRFHVSGGWRTLYVDYEDGDTGFEATLSGPLLGLTWRF